VEADLLVAVAFLALNFYVYHFMARAAEIPPRENFSSFPMEIGGWSCPGSQDIPDDILKALGATDYLVCDFYHQSHAPLSVGFYIGYHESQVRIEGGGGATETSIHPPAHCLPGSGWDIIDSRTVELDMPDLPQERTMAKRLLIAKGEARQLVYYWYQSRGRVITEDWQKILYVGWDRATRGRTDGSLVRFTISMPRNGEEAAEAAFRDFAPGVLAILPRYVPE
jgi:EpsI family protein